jgi:DNA polymerase (family X)
MISNQDISRSFHLYAELLLLHEKDERLAGLLSGAAFRLRGMEEAVMDLKVKILSTLFRPQIVQMIRELQASATIAALDALIQLTPAGLFDMMRIKGLGGKKLALLWKKAKIDNLEDLLKACKNHRLDEIPGFGRKTEQNIIAAIEAHNTSAAEFHYADVADIAQQLVTALHKHFETELISLCGTIRRQATTVAKIEIIAAAAADKFVGLKRPLIYSATDGKTTTAHTMDEIPVTIYHTTPPGFYAELFKRTGNVGHVEKIMKKIKRLPVSEEAIYKNAKMVFIPPEMREDLAEWKYARNPKPLITSADIRGVVHNHTNWSDGVDKLETFVSACKKKGFAYCVISDHSRNAFYAGGLKPDKVIRQLEAIDALNEEMKPFRIFKSTECDILISGELDYEKTLLKKFDLVIVSVHQQLRMSEEKATTRLIKAIENPYTTILGHMTGRQLLIRPGYPLNFKKVIDACAANKVIIELNANPYRLDMDWAHIPYALQKGVMISINPDAHSTGEINNIRWGVAAARKGGLTREMTWNAMSLKEIELWLKKNRKYK